MWNCGACTTPNWESSPACASCTCPRNVWTCARCDTLNWTTATVCWHCSGAADESGTSLHGRRTFFSSASDGTTPSDPALADAHRKRQAWRKRQRELAQATRREERRKLRESATSLLIDFATGAFELIAFAGALLLAIAACFLSWNVLAFAIPSTQIVATRESQPAFFLLGLLTLSALLFALKRAYRLLYGIIETAFGFCAGWKWLMSARENHIVDIIALVGVVYLMTRGIDNCYEARKAAKSKKATARDRSQPTS